MSRRSASGAGIPTRSDGTYTLQSEATDGAALQAFSAGVTIIVENSAPTTDIVVPSSSGTSVSGTQVPLDATASANVRVNKVQYYLTGGSLDNAIIATASPTDYGWLASWNSTTVPNGTYTLQSEASDGAGHVALRDPGGPGRLGVARPGGGPGSVHPHGWIAQ